MNTDIPSPSGQSRKPQRVLACVLCQQRKVKCDRKFPCANCIKSQTQCVPATLTQRRRRRRFPERELLDRLRKYEDLLRHNRIAFEPLHKDSNKGTETADAESIDGSDEEHQQTLVHDASTPSSIVKSPGGYESKNLWHAMSSGSRDPENHGDSSDDDVRETVYKKAWEETKLDDEHLLFGSRTSTVDLSTLHPDPVQIFRLWQLYLDNVNPLLKVTHTPSLQGRIIEAASNTKNIDPTLEALVFSIYCMATYSLGEEDCLTTFGSSREILLTRYQFGCQQALLNCGFLRTSDRNCLTALFLYLISVRRSTIPQSLSSMLGIAIRIAQRMSIHRESVLAKFTPLEAEMSRRLWWALVLYDTRICEFANARTGTLDPTWDCKAPLNVNDSDLRPEMKSPPAVQGKSSEALFAVVRSELGEFLQYAAFHLDFINPALKPFAKHFPNSSSSESGWLDKLEKMLEDQYLSTCDEGNPLHFMTIWTTRSTLARWRLLEHHSTHSTSSVRQTEAQRDIATSYALRMLECDVKIMHSPLIKGFLWLNYAYFPFLAYLQLSQFLRRRQDFEQARRIWRIIDEDFEAWQDSHFQNDGPFFQIFTKIIYQAWEACETAWQQSGDDITPPRIVLAVRRIVSKSLGETSDTNTNTVQPNIGMDLEIDDFLVPTTVDFANSQDQHFNMGMQDNFPPVAPGVYSGMQHPLHPLMNQMGWPGLGRWPGWGGG